MKMYSIPVGTVFVPQNHSNNLKQMLKIVVDLNEQSNGRYNHLINALHLELDMLHRDYSDRIDDGKGIATSRS